MEELVLSSSKHHRWIAVATGAVMGMVLFMAVPSAAQDEAARKIKSKVAPAYPELAKRMNVSGTVKLTVIIQPNGDIKKVKALGGHPILIPAAETAVKQWKYEAAGSETTTVVEVKFSTGG
jgi:TonB family protein